MSRLKQVSLFGLVLILVSGWRPPAPAHECKTLEGHKGPVWSVAFSPDGKLLAAGGHDKDGRIIIWDVASGKQQLSFDEEGACVSDLAFSRDGETIISSTVKWEARLNHSTGKLRWWSLTKKRVVREKPFTDNLCCLALAPDGKLLATSSGTIYNMDIKVWDAKTGDEIATLRGTEDYPCALAFSPDSKRLAVLSRRDRRLVVWDVAKKKALARCYPDGALSVVYSPDGAVVAAGGADGPLTLVDVEKAEERAAIRARTTTRNGLAYLAGGKSLVTACDNELWLLDVATGRVREKVRGHDNSIKYLAVSGDGKMLATASEDETVKLWTLSEGK